MFIWPIFPSITVEQWDPLIQIFNTFLCFELEMIWGEKIFSWGNFFALSVEVALIKFYSSSKKFKLEWRKWNDTDLIFSWVWNFVQKVFCWKSYDSKFCSEANLLTLGKVGAGSYRLQNRFDPSQVSSFFIGALKVFLFQNSFRMLKRNWASYANAMFACVLRESWTEWLTTSSSVAEVVVEQKDPFVD